VSQALILGSDFFHDPYPTYAELRASGGIHQAVLPSGHKVWVITRYEDARAVLVDSRLSKKLSAATADSVIEHMLNSDPPDHTRLRRLVGKAFTAHRVRDLRPNIEKITDELLDAISGRRQVVDLVKEFAFPFATMVLTELLDVPDNDRDTFCRWAETIVDGAEADAPEQAGASMTAMAGYLAWLVAERRTDPGDDLLSVLAHATDGADRLTDVELVMTAFLLLVAGHDTMVGLISNGVFALLCHPDEYDALLADPSLVPAAIEELLRFTGPANFTTLRYTTAEVDVGEVTIPAGEFVVVALNSANHDPERFTGPERLDLRRPAGGHLAFGHGIHYCVGASLARLAGEVAIWRLLSSFPDLRLAAEVTDVSWLTSTLLRVMESLPVMLHRMEMSPQRKES
jgi:cytochrome P450